jgi:hypothetical protein
VLREAVGGTSKTNPVLQSKSRVEMGFLPRMVMRMGRAHGLAKDHRSV